MLIYGHTLIASGIGPNWLNSELPTSYTAEGKG